MITYAQNCHVRLGIHRPLLCRLILGQRSRDSIVSVYSRRTESAAKFAKDYHCKHATTEMEEAIAHPSVDIVCIALPK